MKVFKKKKKVLTIVLVLVQMDIRHNSGENIKTEMWNPAILLKVLFTYTGKVSIKENIKKYGIFYTHPDPPPQSKEKKISFFFYCFKILE